MVVTKVAQPAAEVAVIGGERTETCQWGRRGQCEVIPTTTIVAAGVAVVVVGIAIDWLS